MHLQPHVIRQTSPKVERIAMNKKTSLPSHRVYAVTHDDRQSYWRAIGAIWPHSDGNGFNMQLDYLPLNGADIVIRKPKPGDDDAELPSNPA
jgi:hypothetical protein